MITFFFIIGLFNVQHFLDQLLLSGYEFRCIFLELLGLV